MKLLLPSIVLAVILSSCGLESVESLNAPPANYLDKTLVTEKSLSFVHSASRYSASASFLGYQVFYKVYPRRLVDSDDQLIADRNSLASSKTVIQLKNLGYHTFTNSGDKTGTSSAGIDNLLIQGVSDGATVMLDFTEFLDPLASRINNQPVLKVNGVNSEKPYLYRDLSLAGTKHQSFNGLRTESLTVATRPSDVSSSTTAAEFLGQNYEVNVFVAAYGLTPTLIEVFSEPVPWGVVRVIKP